MISVFRKALVFHIPIPAVVAKSVVAAASRFISTRCVEVFDEEHVVELTPKLYLMQFKSDFVRQVPHYHIGFGSNKLDLFRNGGGKRILCGVTHSGLQVNTYHCSHHIPPASMCFIMFPGAPPTLHQFEGVSGGDGSCLISYHAGKTIIEDKNSMSTLTVRMDTKLPADKHFI